MKISGLAEMEQKLLQLTPKLAKRHLARATRAGAKPLRESAQAKAPVLTGKLRSKIIVKVRANPKQNKVTATVGIRYEGAGTQDPGVYGMFQEFGTKDTPAHPFLRPAFDEAGQKAIDTTVEVLRDGLRDVAG